MLILRSNISGGCKYDVKVSTQSVGDTLHHFKSGISYAALYAADVCTIEGRSISQFLLAEPEQFSVATHSLAKIMSEIHAGTLRSALTIRPRTMSHIFIICALPIDILYGIIA